MAWPDVSIVVRSASAPRLLTEPVKKAPSRIEPLQPVSDVRMLIGLGAGLAASFGLLGFLRSLLFGVQPTDARVLATVSLLLVGVAALASYLPARRATRADPAEALRSE